MVIQGVQMHMLKNDFNAEILKIKAIKNHIGFYYKNEVFMYF